MHKVAFGAWVNGINVYSTSTVEAESEDDARYIANPGDIWTDDCDRPIPESDNPTTWEVLWADPITDAY